MMVGTTLNQVQSYPAIIGQNVLVPKRRGMTTLPPDTSGPITVTICALIW